MPTNDIEMDKMEADFRANINKRTAQRIRKAEQEEKAQEIINHIKAVRKEMRRQKAQDRVYMCAVLGLFGYALCCANAIGIIPLSLTVPGVVICAGFGVGCIVKAVKLFAADRKGGKRK